MSAASIDFCPNCTPLLEEKNRLLEAQTEENVRLKEEVKLLRKLRYAHKSERWTNQDKKTSSAF